MKNVSEYFGSLVFDDRVMKATLSAEVYQSLKKTIDGGERLDISVANAVADAMKDWAVANGATHYTHWFQPLTGITAEKHDSFISPSPDGGLRESLMHHRFHPEDFEQLSKQEDILHGILHLMHLLRVRHYVFLLHSVLMVGKPWIRKLHYFVLWKH